MKLTLLRSLLLGVCCSTSLAALAGGIDVIVPAAPPLVDIPDMREGWGFIVEGSALRGFDNNLDYLFLNNLQPIDVGSRVAATDQTFKNLNPDYAFTLRLGIDYTLADTANVIKLYYEHLFKKSSSSEYQEPLINTGEGDFYAANAHASIKQGLDGVSLLSEQHILIGPYWETTLTGGARFAHVSQKLKAMSDNYENLTASRLAKQNVTDAQVYGMQFNGAGPLAGFGTLFHLPYGFALGAEVQGALLVGQNRITANRFISTYDYLALELTNDQIVGDINTITSLVPEMYYRLYGSFFYQFDNGSQLEVEAGWRANQFFNLRTFDKNAVATVSLAPQLANLVSNRALAVNTTNSDDIGFSGPYLLIHYKL